MIRTVVAGDLWALHRKPHNQIVFYNETLLVQPHRPLWFSLRCLLQGTGRDRLMMVYRDRTASALVQSQGRKNRPEHDILYLSAHASDTSSTALSSDYDLWYRLLERLCIKAGHNAIQRLYVSIWKDQLELREIYRQLGFQAYTHQYVLQLSGPDWDQGTTISRMRAQSRRDAWAVHKLYGLVTPHLVQQAEVRTPRAWMLPLTQRWQPYRRSAWVFGSESDLHAYLHISSGPSAHSLTLLIHPDARDTVADVVRFGLAQLIDNRPVYLLLREYHQELLAPVENLGFQVVGETALLVKHTVVPVRRSVLLPVFETQALDVQITLPNISVPREETELYVTAQRNNQ